MTDKEKWGTEIWRTGIWRTNSKQNFGIRKMTAC